MRGILALMAHLSCMCSLLEYLSAWATLRHDHLALLPAALMPHADGQTAGLMAGPSLTPHSQALLPEERPANPMNHHLMPRPPPLLGQDALLPQPALNHLLTALPAGLLNGRPISLQPQSALCGLQCPAGLKCTAAAGIGRCPFLLVDLLCMCHFGVSPSITPMMVWHLRMGSVQGQPQERLLKGC